MTNKEMEAIAARAARRAVAEMFRKLDIDPGDPESIKRVRRGIAYAARLDEAGEVIRKQGLKTAITIIIGALVGALWLGIKDHLGVLPRIPPLP